MHSLQNMVRQTLTGNTAFIRVNEPQSKAASLWTIDPAHARILYTQIEALVAGLDQAPRVPSPTSSVGSGSSRSRLPASPRLNRTRSPRHSPMSRPPSTKERKPSSRLAYASARASTDHPISRQSSLTVDSDASSPPSPFVSNAPTFFEFHEHFQVGDSHMEHVSGSPSGSSTASSFTPDLDGCKTVDDMFEAVLGSESLGPSNHQELHQHILALQHDDYDMVMDMAMDPGFDIESHVLSFDSEDQFTLEF
jgi:hypothetical protein